MVKKIIRVIKICLFLNLFLSLLQIVVGYLGSSKALFYDGFHSLSDLITDLIVLFGSIVTFKKADDKHPYGHGKIEYLLSIFIGIIVLILGVNIVLNLNNNVSSKPSYIVIVVSLLTIISKTILSNFVISKGKEYDSSVLIASGYESRADVITSILVLVSAILMQFDNKILQYSDFVGSLIIAIFIMKLGIEIILDNSSYIIGEAVIDEEYKKNFLK